MVWDVDWSTVSMRTEDPERMARVLAGWDSHLTHTTLPRTLGSQLRAAGFDQVRMEGHTFATDELSHETYGGWLVDFVEQFVVSQRLVDPEDAKAWATSSVRWPSAATSTSPASSSASRQQRPR